MRFKKIYIEITNGCNLNCRFCIKNKREVRMMSISEYKLIIDKIVPYTKEVYLHVLGEPLLHKNINEFIHYASSQGLFVNITTNGYLIKKLANNKEIHRLNISLHSFSSEYNMTLEEYLDNVFSVVDDIRDKTYVTLRLWARGSNTADIIKYINNRYHLSIRRLKDNEKIKIGANLLIDTFHEFIWPDINNDYYSPDGTCFGLINHIGILVDGRVIPCCLDSLGQLTLGNIFSEDIDSILDKEIVREMRQGFRNNKKCQELCRHCNFLGGSNGSTKLEKK